LTDNFYDIIVLLQDINKLMNTICIKNQIKNSKIFFLVKSKKFLKKLGQCLGNTIYFNIIIFILLSDNPTWRNRRHQ